MRHKDIDVLKSATLCAQLQMGAQTKAMGCFIQKSVINAYVSSGSSCFFLTYTAMPRREPSAAQERVGSSQLDSTSGRGRSARISRLEVAAAAAAGGGRWGCAGAECAAAVG